MVKKSFADILGQVQDAKDKKISRKLPQWAAAEGLTFPSGLALEQCSSEQAALHKLNVLGERLDGAVLCDLTCGLGIDSWAFSSRAATVISYERNTELAACTAANFSRLGISNIELRCEEVGEDCELPECDIIYADPARRDSAGRKVFLLEDCSPDILKLLPKLRQKASLILLKLSPMADISLLCRQLGSELRELHVISLGGEVKELLCLMDRDSKDELSIIVSDISSGQSFSFRPEEEYACKAVMAKSLGEGEYLVEPSAAILKSGAFKLAAREFGLEKLDTSTHLYKAGGPLDSSLFKSFLVEEVLEFSSSSLKELKKRRLRAEVTARNITLNSEELRKKTATLPGGHLHIFACPCAGSRHIFICRREA